MNRSFSEYKERRKQLLSMLEPTFNKEGAVVLFSGFESERHTFRQDSTFYYLTGLEEPGCVLVITTDGSSTLWVPQYGSSRSMWTSTIVEASKKEAAHWGIKDIKHLGHPCKGYTTSTACTVEEYEHLLSGLDALIKKGNALFMIYPEKVTDQTLFIKSLFANNSSLTKAIVDITPVIADMRRTKSRAELELIYEAVDCTMQGQEAAAMRIAPDMYEYQIQAAVEFVFKESGGAPAFPTIVASGTQSTTLHYSQNDQQMKSGDLVIVDCGAEIEYYCADLTTTYPVSGTFTDRQREVYDVVLATQHYIAQLAQPDYWLSNKNEPKKSLHHLALNFLKEKGYEEYFTHAIGHFLGLDVHDVGLESGPLKEGDVITLEPGIYIPDESLGIRIEDVYWVTDTNVVCVSEELPKDSYEIEQLILGELNNENGLL